MENRFVFVLCLASSLLACGALTAQQPPQSSEQQAPPQSSAQQPAPGSKPTPTSEQAYDANVQLMREDIRSERKKIVAANMPLTEAEAVKFWPLYDRYIGETVRINDVRYGLIKDYARNYQTMTDAQAHDFVRRWVALDGDNAQLRLKYIPEFEKVISQKKTAIFFQIDRRVAMMIDLQLASEIPLVKP